VILAAQKLFYERIPKNRIQNQMRKRCLDFIAKEIHV